MGQIVNPDTLEIWLEWAAAKQIAMPSGQLFPSDPRAAWPEYSRDRFQVLEYRRVVQMRALAPSSKEIPIMDAINELPNLCKLREIRQTVRLRTQIHPIRQTHLITWNGVAKKMKTKIHIVRYWYKNGLEEIAEKAPKPIVCRIAAFLKPYEISS